MSVRALFIPFLFGSHYEYEHMITNMVQNIEFQPPDGECMHVILSVTLQSPQWAIAPGLVYIFQHSIERAAECPPFREISPFDH